MDYIIIYFCCAILGAALAAFVAEFFTRFRKYEEEALLIGSALIWGQTAHNFLSTMYDFAHTAGTWNTPDLLNSSLHLAIGAAFMPTLVIFVRKRDAFKKNRKYFLSFTAVSIIWFAASLYFIILL